MPSLEPPYGVIPDSPSELTPTWLAAVLARHGYSAAIEKLEFEPLEGALTSETARLIVRFQDETTGVAPRLLWKRSLADPEARAEFQRGYAQEVRFYREVGPARRVSAPRCFVAAHDAERGGHVLLLEDLSPMAAADLAAGVSVDRAGLVLSELARVHAIEWTDGAAVRPPEEFARLTDLVERLAPTGAAFLERHADERAAERTRLYASEVAGLFAELAAGPQALCHGDMHPGNVLFAEEERRRPVLIDWQGCHVDSPLRDVARFLVLGLSTVDRRAHEEDLLRGYLDDLAEAGVTADRGEMTRLYRRALLLQWGWAVIFFRLESKWDEATRRAMPTLVRRAAAAFDDATL